MGLYTHYNKPQITFADWMRTEGKTEEPYWRLITEINQWRNFDHYGEDISLADWLGLTDSQFQAILGSARLEEILNPAK